MAPGCSRDEGSPERVELNEQEEEELRTIRHLIYEAMLWAFEDEKQVEERISVIFGILRYLRLIIDRFSRSTK